MATDSNIDPNARKQADHNGEIWVESIGFLILLAFLPAVILLPAFQEWEPFLGFSIALVAVILGWRLLVVSHKVAELAQDRVPAKQSPERLETSRGGWFNPPVAAVAGGVLLFAVLFAAIASIPGQRPAVGELAFAGVGLYFFFKLLRNIPTMFPTILEKLRDGLDKLLQKIPTEEGMFSNILKGLRDGIDRYLRNRMEM
jgi:hypothetical protein